MFRLDPVLCFSATQHVYSYCKLDIRMCFHFPPALIARYIEITVFVQTTVYAPRTVPCNIRLLIPNLFTSTKISFIIV